MHYSNESINGMEIYENEKTKKIIEIHNRPSYVNIIYPKTKAKIVLYFHNDPLEMNGSKSISDRMNLFNKVEKVIFKERHLFLNKNNTTYCYM